VAPRKRQIAIMLPPLAGIHASCSSWRPVHAIATFFPCGAPVTRSSSLKMAGASRDSRFVNRPSFRSLQHVSGTRRPASIGDDLNSLPGGTRPRRNEAAQVLISSPRISECTEDAKVRFLLASPLASIAARSGSQCLSVCWWSRDQSH
jgi:hypothetical protein